MGVKQAFLTLLMIGTSVWVYGQSSKDVGPPTPPRPQYQVQKKKKTKVNVFKKKPKTYEEEFQHRMREVQKKKAKEEKLAQKPQYSNPLYFGHKKPPKKRPLHKRKLCKTCNIVH